MTTPNAPETPQTPETPQSPQSPEPADQHTPPEDTREMPSETTAAHAEPAERPLFTEPAERPLFTEPAEPPLFTEPAEQADFGAGAPSRSAETEPTGPARPPRPSGPHVPAILLGIACVVIAVIAIAQEVGSLKVDWGNVGPLGIVAAGGILVVLGLVGLMSSRRSSDNS